MKLTLGKKLGLAFGAMLALMLLSAFLTYTKVNAMIGKQDRAFSDALKKPLGEMADSFDSLLQQSRDDLNAGTRSLNQTLMFIALAGLAVGAFVAVFISRDVAAEAVAEKLMGAEFSSQLAAIGKSQAVIEFKMDGTVVTANENFLSAMGYSLDEIMGRHHSMFVDETSRHGIEYKEFWAKLNRGEYQAGEYKRLGRGGKEVWLQASYNPILDLEGKPSKVIKYATEITRQVNTMQQVAETAVSLSSASEELTTVSQQMSANAEETSAQARVVSDATQQVSQNLQTVATGAEEMGASIKEIAKNATEAAKVATAAVKVAETATATVSKL